MPRWLIITVVIGVLVAVGGAVAFALVVREASEPGERTAAFLPGDTQVYFSVNLRPGLSQLNHARRFISIIQTEEFLDNREDLLDEFEDETGIDLLEDVVRWIGEDMTIALLDASASPAPEWVALVRTTDAEASLSFLEDLADYLEDQQSIEFQDDTYRGAEIFVSEDDELAFGLTDEYVLFATNEDVIKDTVRDLETPPTRPLAEDLSFVAAQEALPSGRVAFFYFQSEGFVRQFEEIIDPFGDQPDVLNQLEENLPETIALSASFFDKGFLVDGYSVTPLDALVTEEEDDLGTAEALPADTLIYLSFTGMGEAWQELLDQIQDQDRAAADAFDQGLRDFADETGVDLERDIIEQLTGEVSLALLPSYFRFDDYLGNFESGTVEAVLLAEIADSAEMEDTLETLVEWAEDQGVELYTEGIGEYEAFVVDLSGSGPPIDEYEPGYYVTENLVVGATTIDSLMAVNDALSGSSETLRASHEFSRLIDLAPEPLQFVLFADIAGLIEMVVDSLPREYQSDYDDTVSPFVEHLSAMLVASSITEERTRFTLAVTVRE